MKILIVFGSTEGQTRKIAGAMADHFTLAGHAVTLADATHHPPVPKGFDLVILGASVHAGRYQMPLAHYAEVNAAALNNTHSAFFSVSLSAAGHEAEARTEVERIAVKFADATGWQPERIEHIAGALKYTKYDFSKRFIMRVISGRNGGSTDTSQDHEYTDWKQVERFCGQLAAVKPAVTRTDTRPDTVTLAV